MEPSQSLDTHRHMYHEYRVPDPPHQPMFLKPILHFLVQSPLPIRTILEVGCGDGNFSESLAHAGYTMFGIDLSKGGIQKAMDRKLPNASFAVASAYNDYRLIFSNQRAFDAIVSVEVIEHLYDPREFVRRVHEALRPGGTVIITTPYWGYWINIVRAISNRMDKNLSALWDGGHIKHFSYQTLRCLFEEGKFKFVAFRGAGRLPFLWKGMIQVFRKEN